MLYIGHVARIGWEVIESEDTPEVKFFRIVDSDKEVLVSGSLEFGKYIFRVEGRDHESVDLDEDVVTRDILEMGRDTDLVTICHLIADDIATEELRNLKD